MEEVNLVKLHKEYYSARQQPEHFHAGKGAFLVVDGRGDPDGEEFPAGVQALYSVAYTLRFMYKDRGTVFKLAPLEGFWWVFDDARDAAFASIPRSEWKWQLVIRVPEFVKKTDFKAACAELEKKKKAALASSVRLETIDQGDAVHILHIGPYSEEAASLRKLDDFMEQGGMERVGRHHEIYLSDPRRTAPERIKTILMYQVRRP